MLICCSFLYLLMHLSLVITYTLSTGNKFGENEMFVRLPVKYTLNRSPLGLLITLECQNRFAGQLKTFSASVQSYYTQLTFLSLQQFNHSTSLYIKTSFIGHIYNFYSHHHYHQYHHHARDILNQMITLILAFSIVLYKAYKLLSLFSRSNTSIIINIFFCNGTIITIMKTA